jgi:hypothetical protein
MVQRHEEHMIGQDGAGMAVAAHDRTVPGRRRPGLSQPTG